MTTATTQDPFLSIQGVSKKFGEFTALSDISLEIFEGEFVCFLGPSGCGKTTLLRAIAGLDIQSTGRIVQAGQDISELPPSERDFGIVFQSYALFPNMSVAKNVAYGLENQSGNSRAEVRSRVADLLALVGLPDQGSKYPAQLSGGQQQRVALARAIATSPGLLLLDEPLSALDAKVRAHLRHEVKDLQQRLGITTVMVTHDQEEALTMADRIVVMSDGRIEQVGTPEGIYQQPQSAFVADFVGTMNFVPATVARETVMVGGASLTCNTEGLEDGRLVTVAIRPEDFNFAVADAAAGNQWSVEITTLEFLGSFVRIGLKWGTGEPLRAFADVSANLYRRLALRSGETHTVSLPEEYIRLYPGATRHE